MDFLSSIKKVFKISNSRVKVPTILQMKATECGAASLAMVLASFGLWLPWRSSDRSAALIATVQRQVV